MDTTDKNVNCATNVQRDTNSPINISLLDSSDYKRFHCDKAQTSGFHNQAYLSIKSYVKHKMDKIFSGPIGSKLAMFVVVNNGFISGMAVSWLGASLIIDDSSLNMTMTQASVAVCAFYAGQALATVPFSLSESSLGKKRMLQIGITFIVFGWLIIYLSVNLYVAYVGRFVLGVWISMSYLSSSPYLAEVASPSIRGRVVSFIAIQFMWGAIFESIMAIFCTYFHLALLNLSFGILQFICLQFIPESPYHMLRKGNMEGGEKMFYWFRGNNKDEFDKTVSAVNAQMSLKSRFTDICKYPLSRSAFILGITLTLFQRVSSILPVYAYTAYVLPDNMKPQYVRILFYSIALVCVVISGNYVDRIGRRKLLIISAIGSCLFCTITTVWFTLSELMSITIEKANWVPLVGTTGEIAFNSLGILYIPTVITSEMFPLNIKAKALTLLQLNQLILIIANVRIFMVLKERKITFIIYFVYTFVLVLECFYYIQMYDTKGKTLEEIHAHFEEKGRKRSTLGNTFVLLKKSLMPQKNV